MTFFAGTFRSTALIKNIAGTSAKAFSAKTVPTSPEPPPSCSVSTGMKEETQEYPRNKRKFIASSRR